MDSQHLAAAELEPPDIPADRLYRISPEVYRRMVEHGLLGGGVEIQDGLLIVKSANGGSAELLDRLYRVPLEAYHGIAEHGLLGPSDGVVLLDGILVKKMTKGHPHVAAGYLASEALRVLAIQGWHVKHEAPLTLAAGPGWRASEPEPDVTVVRGRARDYLTRHPGAGDVAIVVEVAKSSLRKDRAGLARFARAGVPVVWLVNLKDGVIEAYSSPTGPTQPAKYQDLTTYGAGDEIPVVIDGREAGRIPARDVLP